MILALIRWTGEEGGVNTGDDATDDELVPGQMLYTIIRGLKGIQRDLKRTPGIEVIWITVPIVTKEAPATHQLLPGVWIPKQAYQCTYSFSFQLCSHKVKRTTLQKGTQLRRSQCRTLA